jgi:hypothetical protein
MSPTKQLDQILAEFREMHGDKYNYDKLNYINGKIPVIINCNVHGANFS